MSQQSQPDLKARLAEADLYFQHGLKENAKVIYKEILDNLPPEHSARGAIEKKIQAASPSAPPPKPTSAPLGSEPIHRFENCLGLIEAEVGLGKGLPARGRPCQNRRMSAG